jgi:hypothetical protein
VGGCNMARISHYSKLKKLSEKILG